MIKLLHQSFCVSKFQSRNFLIFCQFKVLVMSASANKLSKFKQQAPTYAALIMEELDPDNQGYVEVKLISFS